MNGNGDFSNGEVVFISRKEKFSAGHRLISKHLTEEENIKWFGKCYHPSGHGHNYTGEAPVNRRNDCQTFAHFYNEHLKRRCINGNRQVVVTLKGKLDPITGMIVNFNELAKWMQTAIVEPLDHKNLYTDIDFFKDRTTTTENLAVFVWQEMTKIMTDPSMLHEVKVKSTDKNTVIYRGESC